MNWQQLKFRLKTRMQRFMYGRNGADQLTFFVIILSLFTLLASDLFKLIWLRYLTTLGFAYTLYRMLSKDLLKRRRENRFYLQQKSKLKSWFRVQKKILQERKTHRHFKCPSCGQRLRVPKGRGQITITCPKCRRQFQGKS